MTYDRHPDRPERPDEPRPGQYNAFPGDRGVPARTVSAEDLTAGEPAGWARRDFPPGNDVALRPNAHDPARMQFRHPAVWTPTSRCPVRLARTFSSR